MKKARPSERQKRQGLGIPAEDFEVLFGLARALHGSGELGVAAEAARQAAAKARDAAEGAAAWNQAGRSLLAQGKKKLRPEAIAAFQRAAELDPSLAEARLALAEPGSSAGTSPFVPSRPTSWSIRTASSSSVRPATHPAPGTPWTAWWRAPRRWPKILSAKAGSASPEPTTHRPW